MPLEVPPPETSDTPNDDVQIAKLYDTFREGADTARELATSALAHTEATPTAEDQARAEKDTLEVFDNQQASFEHFEKQFEMSHQLSFGEDSIDYRKVIPEKVSNEQWVVFVGGFNTSAENYRDEIANLVHAGRKVLFINPEIPKSKINPNEYSEVLGSIAPLLRHEVKALETLLIQEGVETADVVGHSRGALVATAFSASHPEVAKRLVLDCPAGLSGKEDAWALLSRAMAESASEKEVLKAQGVDLPAPKPGTDFLAQFGKNTWWKLNSEVPAIAQSDIRPLFSRIRAKRQSGESSTEVILINAHNDKIFTPDHIERALGSDPFAYVDRWVSYADKEAGHGIISRPDVGLYPQIVNDEEDISRRRHRMILQALDSA